MVSALEEGYALDCIPISSLLDLRSRHPQFNVEITKMMQKGAQEAVHNCDPQSPGFYSRIFPVPTKTRDNQIRHRSEATVHFLGHIEIQARDSTKHPKRLVGFFSIDLKDAYFYLLMHPSSRRYIVTAGYELWKGYLHST